MWYFRVVAMDLDGTLAVDDRVAPEVLTAIDDARAERTMLLVTGRVWGDLERVFPGLSAHFDAIVTENGAVLRTPIGTRALHEPVDVSVDKALADRGITARRGEVLLAIDGADAAAAAEVIAGLGLDHQVVHNRGSAMILPAGVTKGSGLLAAVDELGLSAHNTIAVGDAENDLSLLRAAEVGAAVADAVPSLAQHADLILDLPDGAGVTGMLTGPLLRGHQRLCPPRRWLPIGLLDNGEPALVPASQSSLLVTGETGSGKSYLAGLLAERWVDAGYSVLLIDPEGDHKGLGDRAGVHLVDAGVHLPTHHDLLDLLRPRHASAVLDLSGLDMDAQLAYIRLLPKAVAAARALYGVPHWVIYDEAHQQAWHDAGAPLIGSLAEAGTCLVTWSPELLPDEVTRPVDITIHLTPAADGTANMTGSRATMTTAGRTQSFTIGERASAHVRHWHKYVDTPLPLERRFYFHGRGSHDAGAATLEDFSRQVEHCELGTLDYHLTRGDFSRWIIGTFADFTLARELANIERDLGNRKAAALEQARQQVYETIRGRYRG